MCMGDDVSFGYFPSEVKEAEKVPLDFRYPSNYTSALACCTFSSLLRQDLQSNLEMAGNGWEEFCPNTLTNEWEKREESK